MFRLRFLPICFMVVSAGCGDWSGKNPDAIRRAEAKARGEKVDDTPKVQEAPADQPTLTEARAGFKSRLVDRGIGPQPLDQPPAGTFRVVDYPSPAGNLKAYLTPHLDDGKKHPAIIWITGGDCNSIGDVWSPQSTDNDQSASAYRREGIVMMFPSLRGGNENPGQREGFLGEVDDVIAAAEFLSKQPYVDPSRIYLGGHSTGGTLVLLVAECTDRFRAVFSFGPVETVAHYPNEYLPFRTRRASAEFKVRAPGEWLHAIKSPTFVFEGKSGNIDSLYALTFANRNPLVRCYEVRSAGHFDVLAPINSLIAQKILSDTGPTCNVSFSPQEVNAAAAKVIGAGGP